jgi:hypothetical protein
MLVSVHWCPAPRELNLIQSEPPLAVRAFHIGIDAPDRNTTEYWGVWSFRQDFSERRA